MLHVLRFLTDLEKRRREVVRDDDDDEDRVAFFNLYDELSALPRTPVFSATSADAVEIVLAAFPDELIVANPHWEGMTLVHYCVTRCVIRARVH